VAIQGLVRHQLDKALDQNRVIFDWAIEDHRKASVSQRVVKLDMRVRNEAPGSASSRHSSLVTVALTVSGSKIEGCAFRKPTTRCRRLNRY
jgi:hypothetical protein